MLYCLDGVLYIGAESYINDALMRGGVAVVCLFYDVAHCVVLTGVEAGGLRKFDPYYEEDFDTSEI